MDERVIKFDEAVAYLKNRVAIQPEIGIILGSGLGKLADRIEGAVVVPYGDIPHFKKSTAVGHKGNLIFGELGGCKVVAMQGRFHYYEGYTMEEVTFPVRVMARMGVKQLFVSNAAGGINPTLKVGDLMIIKDHINLLPNPLIGKNIEEMGVRFPDMTTAYSPRIRRIVYKVAEEMGLMLKEGVYVGGTGPSYETPAEYKFFGTIGGDAVGMSTVPEVIVACHSGMEVFGMSVITNEASALNEEVKNDENDVVIAADKAADKMTDLFEKVIRALR